MATGGGDDGGPVPELAARARACADRLREADSVLVASHIDADGLSSAAVATRALARAGVDHEVTFSKQLDEDEIGRVAAESERRDHDAVLFTDFGSGQLDLIAAHEAADHFDPVIADHHQPADAETEHHLNPLLEGLDGATELSGAGAAYVLARALEDGGTDNRDLAATAVVGAVGDQQAGPDGLRGANRGIVREGVAAGVLDAEADVSLYGRQTRDLSEMLTYADERMVPGVAGDEAEAASFLGALAERGVDVAPADGWTDLDEATRETVVGALAWRALAGGDHPAGVDERVGDHLLDRADGDPTVVRAAVEGYVDDEESDLPTLPDGVAEYDDDERRRALGRVVRERAARTVPPAPFARAVGRHLLARQDRQTAGSRLVDAVGPADPADAVGEAGRGETGAALAFEALAASVSDARVDRADELVSERYTLADEAVGSPLRDAGEFSTVLNATARYGRQDVGLAVARGSRGEGVMRPVEALRANHSRNIGRSIGMVTSGLFEEGTGDHLQWFDGGAPAHGGVDPVPATVVGIVAGIVRDDRDDDRPIVAFARKNEGGEPKLKVSARGDDALVERGLDLSAAMREASRAVGGDGGGHDVAAGATIPADERDVFLTVADQLVGEQVADRTPTVSTDRDRSHLAGVSRAVLGDEGRDPDERDTDDRAQ